MKKLVYEPNPAPIAEPLFHWDSAEDLPLSGLYTLKCGGKDVRVSCTDYFHYAPTTVEDSPRGYDLEITVSVPFSRVDIRPSRLGIVPEIDGNVIRFHVDRKEKLSVEIDGGLHNALFVLMTGKVEKPADTTIFFEKGKVYNVGVLNLKTGDTVYVEEGAVVLGSVFAEHADHISIVGNGVICGSCWHPADRNAMGHMLRFRYCTGLHIKGVTVVDGPNWQVVPMYCKDVLIEDMNVMSTVVAGDGIDVTGSSNVEIRDCFVRASDDCICIKSGQLFRAEEGTVGETHDMRVSGCVCWNAEPGNGIEIGYETMADVYNVTFEDCDVIHSQYEGNMAGAALSIHQANGGHIHHIYFKNIRVEQAEQKLFDLKTLDCKYSHEDAKGMIDDIYFENISLLNGPEPMSIIRGFELADRETRLKNISFTNISILGKRCKDLYDLRMLVELAHDIYIDGERFCERPLF